MSLLCRFHPPFVCVLVVPVLFASLAAMVPRLHAECSGAANVKTERVGVLRQLLPGAAAPARLQVLAEVPSLDGKMLFQLSSLRKGATPGPETVFLSVTTTGSKEELLLMQDLSKFFPSWAGESTEPGTARFISAPSSAASYVPPRIEVCLNPFVLKPDMQAIHLNLFAKSGRLGIESATDVIMAVPQDGTVRPALEFRESSKRDPSPIRRDSVIALLPDRKAATDVIWRLSTGQETGSITAGHVQTALYNWDGSKFHKTGMLEPDDLAERMAKAYLLPRSEAVTPFYVEYITPGPNQPSPLIDDYPKSAGIAIDKATRKAAQQEAERERSPTDSWQVLNNIKGFKIDPYLTTVSHRVRECWYSAVNRSIDKPNTKQGTVVATFTITARGEIQDLRIAVSSEQRDLDDAVMEAMNNVGSLPPLPKELPSHELKMRFSFHYMHEKNHWWNKSIWPPRF